MTGLNPGVRPATEDDHEAAAEALALAFADDPAWAHLLPDDATRAERLLVFFTAEIGNLIPEHRQLWVTEDGSGAAIWAHPGRWRVPLARTLRPARRMAAEIPSYLESSTERNRVLYERNGFSLKGTLSMPAAGPELRKMWRDPIPPST